MAHPLPTQDQIIDETAQRLQAWMHAEASHDSDIPAARLAAAAAVIGAQVERELSWPIGA